MATKMIPEEGDRVQSPDYHEPNPWVPLQATLDLVGDSPHLPLILWELFSTHP